jgi:hypothetical protein
MKCIATTTIYPPSKATLAFAEIARNEGWVFVIAGDKKTPHEAYRDLSLDNKSVVYLTPDRQDFIAHELSDAIGWNSIQRRNLAFVYAWDMGAEVIASVDDDNIPHEGWGRDLMLGRKINTRFIEIEECAFDPLSAVIADAWHRGYPVQMIADRFKWNNVLDADVIADIQADLWNGDPDIDAMRRITHPVHKRDWVIDPNYFPFASNAPSPFNSQNTFFTRKVLPHYFMQIGVGRADDIWAGFHAQAQGFKVIYGKPSVTQERNPQDVMKNFEDELLNYRHNLDICRDIPHYKNAVIQRLPEKSRIAFELYQERCR